MKTKKRFTRPSTFLTLQIINIYNKLTHKQILESRKNRNWNEFDKLDQTAKWYDILRELTLYNNSIKP